MLESELTEMQVRVLGCLAEKKATTPDQYPLTINALRTACNQKTSRLPVVDYSEGQVGHTVRELMAFGLVVEAFGARATRYEHRIGEVLEIRRKEMAVLVTLMLRGPQTAGELRTRCHRMYEFEDPDDVEFVLQHLNEQTPPLAYPLPRQAGQKEQRYAHGLSGELDLSELPTAPVAVSRSNLADRVAQLESEVEWLKRKVIGLIDRDE